MNKILVGILIAGLAVLGVVFPRQTVKLGGNLVENVQSRYINGLYAGKTNQFAVDSSGNVSTSGSVTTTGAISAATYVTATLGSSSSSPAALGSSAAGHLIVAAGATTASASTTAVTANSVITLQLESTTPIAGTTCNSAVNASSTEAITTKVAGNGFTITVAGAPVTNPFCFSYRIVN